MKKLFLTLFTLSLAVFGAKAQDFIELKSSTILSIKIINANELTMVYKSEEKVSSISIDSVKTYYIDDEKLQSNIRLQYPALNALFDGDLPARYNFSKQKENANAGLNLTDTIVYSSSFWTGDKISMGTRNHLRLNDIKGYLTSNTDAGVFYEKAKTNKTFSTIFALAGGFSVGYALGSAIGGKDINLPLVGVGAVCLALSVPLHHSYSNNMAKAVRAYNKKILAK